MSRVAWLAVALFAGGCADNQALCERSTERINEVRLDCGLTEVDPTGSCFAFAQLDEQDCGAYFACEADRYSCEDGQLIQSSESCPPCD